MRWKILTYSFAVCPAEGLLFPQELELDGEGDEKTRVSARQFNNSAECDSQTCREGLNG